MDRQRLAAIGLTVLLGLTGCGGGTEAPGVASAAGTGAPAADPTAAALTRYVDAQRQWVGCMRTHGYDLPDPDAKGAVDVGGFLRAAKLPKTDPGFVDAQRQCAPVQPTVPVELEDRPQLTAQQLEHRRAYSRCMRANGMPNWPDPGPNGDFPAEGMGSVTEAEQRANLAALQICDPVLDGRPPTTPDPNSVPQG